MEYRKNQILTVRIDDIGRNGEGIGRYEDYILFVKDAVCGDFVKARITKVKKNYAYARCEEIITASPDRTEPLCALDRRCGGCQIMGLSYTAQLKFKENKAKNDLIRIGGIHSDQLERMFEQIIGMEDPSRYRNKAQYPVGTDREGNVVAGFYAGRTHSIIPCSDCMISPEENARILDLILGHMREHGIKPYDEITGQGVVRHVLIRKGFSTGRIMVCLVIRHKKKGSSGEFLPGQYQLVQKLSAVTGVESVCVSVNNDNTNVIMGRELHTIWGSDTISDILLGKRFEISPLSFYQVNPVQTEKLYSVAIDFANLSGSEEVWDICCGIGTISLCMADRAGFVHGLEIVPEAIEDARKNAEINGVENVDFVCAAAEEYLPVHKDEIKADVIVLDPPRKGMDEAALDAICSVAPDRIVYVSCDSATLARDVKYLTERGYSLRRIRCVDMFPHTVHVETVVLMGKTVTRSKSHVDLGLDVEDYYRIKEAEKEQE